MPELLTCATRCAQPMTSCKGVLLGCLATLRCARVESLLRTRTMASCGRVVGAVARTVRATHLLLPERRVEEHGPVRIGPAVIGEMDKGLHADDTIKIIAIHQPNVDSHLNLHDGSSLFSILGDHLSITRGDHPSITRCHAICMHCAHVTYGSEYAHVA